MRILAILSACALSALTAGCGDGSDPSCSDECPGAGAFGCASPPQNGLVVCADFDDDDCLEWGGFFACENGAACVDSACAGGCEDECPSEGETVCDGDGTRSCGSHDGDPCLEWSAVSPCTAPETCSDGTCSSSCTDECDDGDRRCDGAGYRTCGQTDDDACRDWSPIEPCAADESCEDGQCQPAGCLEGGEDCECGENQCCEGHCCPFLFICVSFPPDEDYCF